jgi:hypothetical protein
MSAPAASLPVRARRRARVGERPPGEPRRVAYLYVLPGLAVFVAFVLLPLLHSGWISLFAWDGITPGEWVALDNYKAVFTDPDLRAAFLHALILLVFYSVLPIVIGLLLAASMSRTRVRGLAAFRTILFLPQVIALVVVAGDVAHDLRAGRGPAQRGPAGRWAWAARAELAGGLRARAALRRADRHVGDVRPGHGPVHGRRPEDPAVALRRAAWTAPGRCASSSRSRCRACAARSPSR